MNEGPQNLFTRLVTEFEVLLEPLAAAPDDPRTLYAILSRFGWNLGGLVGADLTAINAAVDSVRSAIGDVSKMTSVDDIEGVVKTLQSLYDALKKLKELRTAITSALAISINAATGETLGRDLLEYLLIEYLARRAPILYQLQVLLTIIRYEQPTIVHSGGAGSTILRYPLVRPTLKLENLSKLLSDPLAHLKASYLPSGGLINDSAAQAMTEELFGYIEMLVFLLGGQALAGMKDMPENDSIDPANVALLRSLTTAFSLGSVTTNSNTISIAPQVGATFTLIPSDSTASTGDRGPGVEVVPFGMVNLSKSLSSWDLLVDVKSSMGTFYISTDTITFVNPSAPYLNLTIKLTKVSSQGTAFLIGSNKGTRLEIGQFAIIGHADLNKTNSDYGLLLEIGSAALVVSPGEGDGFLQKVLPRDGVRTDFDLAIGWSKRKGLYFRGSAGLEATLPVHVSLLDALTVDSVYLALHTKDAAVETAIALTASIKLGPFSGNVERMGLLAAFTFPPEGGNLGPVNVRLGFKPPSGVGMAIDASAIVGGGYLFFDPDNEQYAGILQLEIQKIVSLKAIGLLTTRMPDGSKGFSLLVIISAEFPAIQLGFGFTLTGVGGLLGVNRTMVVDVLRNGLRNGTLGSVLFPQNPVERAQKIISDLRSIFPVAPARFVFGPVARIGWGANNLITAELGIILELPQPIRLVILGRLTLALPNEKSPVVLIHLDTLGVIDFDKGDVSLDATIYDSKIAIFALTGDMALRLSWGSNPAFAVAVGGFNPRFQPPPNFPQLNRLAISLATSDNPRIRLETYLALTANTFQFGARLDVYAEVDAGVFGIFSASGYMGFDALVQMVPLQFIVDIDSGVTIKHNGHAIFSAQLHLSLSGPEPLHAWGEATFKFLGERRIPFDLTMSTGAIQPPLTSIDPLEKLIEELRAKANWSAQLPRDENMLVTLRKIEVVDEILAHPLGELTVRQKAVPLEVMITKFGNSSPTQSGPFLITSLRMGDQAIDQPRETVRDFYPLGEFFNESDEKKLAGPAFEALLSGCSRIGTTAIRHSATQVKATVQYDTVVVDKLEERQARTGAAFAYNLPGDIQAALAGLGAAGQSAMRATGSAKYAGPDRQKVKLVDTEYVVASSDDMSWQKADKKPTYTEAEAAQQQKGAPNGRYQVVGAHEVR